MVNTTYCVRPCDSGDALVQMKGMRACASGVSWPEHNQEQAGFKYSTAVELVKAAMSAHMDNVEVLLVAMEALVKYSTARRADDLKKDGGEGLVKAIRDCDGTKSLPAC